MENESHVFTRVDHPILAPSRSRKLHHMDTEDATNDETDEEDELIRPAKPARKPKKHLRRRSSLHAELEGSDTFDPYEYQDSFTTESPIFKKSTTNGHHTNGTTPTITMLDPHTNMHSSMSMLSMSTSTNNAITVAPSRKSKVELNVFDTRHHKRHHRRKRSSTPDPGHHHNNHLSNHHHHRHHNHRQPAQSKEDGLQSLLERLDNRIKHNFGDWTSADDDTNFEYRNIGRVPPPHSNNHESKGALQHGTVQHSNNVAVSLPPLYKNYQAVLKSAKGKLMDRTSIALSKDNNDAKSILSEAKRTLTQMGADRVSN